MNIVVLSILLTKFLESAQMFKFIGYALRVLGFEIFHTVLHIMQLVCRVCDRFADAAGLRCFNCFRQITGMKKVVVSLPSGTCIGEVVTEMPFSCGAATVVLFEGISYATACRFGPPLQLPSGKHCLNAPRFANLSYRFGSSATHAPQGCGILSLDAPVLVTGIQSAILRCTRGYLGGEDCLQLNIWAPLAAVRNSSKLPVLVFFHGGAFLFGSCHQKIANGQTLAESGKCVVVSCNYRLGILGYLYVPGAPCQNRGLRDQVEALRWVQRHIHSFGGDCNNVSVAGQSAGSMSVNALLGLAECYDQRLFSKAVMFSGTSQFLPTKKTAQQVFELTLKLSGKSSAEELVEFLTTGDLQSVMKLQLLVERESSRLYCDEKSHLLLAFQPFVEGSCSGISVLPPILPYLPSEYIRFRASNNARLVPLLIGTTDCEYTFFTRISVPLFPIGPTANLRSRLRQLTGGAYPQHTSTSFEMLLSNVERAFSSGSMLRRVGPPHALLNAVSGDFLFRLPSEHLSNLYSTHGLCWMYRFDRPAFISSLGATHALDLHYFFGSWWCPPYYTGGGLPDVRALAAKMQSELIQWISLELSRTSTHSMPWPCWSAKTRPLRLYGSVENSESRVGYDVDACESRSWGDVIDYCVSARNEESPL